MSAYLFAWIPLVALAIINGAVCENSFGRRVPELRAHQLSTLLGAGLMGSYVWLVLRTWPPATRTHALQIGCLWVVLTAAFEFAFGHFIRHRTWRSLVADCDPLRGRLLSVFFVLLGLSPLFYYEAE